MSGRRSPAVRFFYSVLACAVLWFSSASAAAAPQLTDTIVLVAGARGIGPSSAASAQHRRSPTTACACSIPRVGPMPVAPGREPAGTTKNLVLIRYRYLHNCTILC